MIIDNSEIDWLNQNYSGLAIINIDKSSILIRGNLKFQVAYNRSDDKYIINPLTDIYSHPIIRDSYSIEIFSYLDSRAFPVIKNTDGRLLEIAQGFQRDCKDFHVYPGPFPDKNTL